MGYEGLELSAAHLDMHRAASDPAYVQQVKDTLAKYGLGCWSISNHLGRPVRVRHPARRL